MGFLSDMGASLFGSGADALIAGRQASKNREFQSQMSSTAHQREVHDLKLAGLNPILSAGGRGASSPAGGMAPASSLGQAAAGASSRSIQRQQMRSNVRNVDAIGASNAVQAKMDQDALRLYNSDPSVKRAVTGGILGRKAGTGPVGAVVGSSTSALQRLRNAVRKQVDRDLQPRLRKHYRKLNEGLPFKASVDYKSSPQYVK